MVSQAWEEDRRLWPLTGRLAVSIRVYPPDKRRRDLDNLMKCLIDALQHAGMYQDDSQIDRLLVTREDLGGYVEVAVCER